MKNVRLILVAALFGISATAVFADGVDPLVGIKHGGGSTPITITNPDPVVNATAGTTGCSIAGDTCVVDVFQNQLGTPLTSLTIFIATVIVNGNPLAFNCNPAETDIFANCASTVVSGGTDLFFSGGSVPSATLQCTGDGDLDDLLNGFLGCPNLFTDSDDYSFVGGEFAVDIEGTLTNGTPDLPNGTPISTQAVTTPEPASALLLVLGMLAFSFVKLGRRTA